MGNSLLYLMGLFYRNPGKKGIGNLPFLLKFLPSDGFVKKSKKIGRIRFRYCRK